MQKYKIGASVNTYSTREQLRMIYRHHERLNEKYANKNVDLTLKQNNYYYVAPDTGKSYIAMFKEKEEEGLFSTKGISREYPVDEIVIEVKDKMAGVDAPGIDGDIQNLDDFLKALDFSEE